MKLQDKKFFLYPFFLKCMHSVEYKVGLLVCLFFIQGFDQSFQLVWVCPRESFSVGKNKSWDCTNLKFLGSVRVFIHINFPKAHAFILFGHFFVHWLYSLAWRTPNSSEVHDMLLFKNKKCTLEKLFWVMNRLDSTAFVCACLPFD